MATIDDVASRAGVSAGTVSNVLNRPSYVSAETLAKVKAAIDELGYVPRSSSRQFRPGRSRTVAMLLETVANPFFVDLALGAEQVVRSADAAFLLLDSGDDVRQERLNLDIAVQQRVQGLLISPVEEDNVLLDSYLRQGVPVVFLDRIRSHRARCSVSVDHLSGGRLAAAHLIDLGHTRLALVGGRTSFRQIDERLRGAAQAAADSGLTLAHFPTRGLTVPDGVQAGRELAATPAAVRPSAVICASDLVAMGLLQECRRQGIDVPGELSIVGYDNLELSAATAVPLTTVGQPRREMGAIAARLLLDELDLGDAHVHQQVILEPELIYRDSVAAHPGKPDVGSPERRHKKTV